MIRVLIVDDQQIIREGLKTILSLDSELIAAGEFANGEDLISFLRQTPDFCGVILMDIRMPVMDGVRATQIVKTEFPQIKVLILTTFDDNDYIFGSLINGADGYLFKNSSSNALIRAVKDVYDGQKLLSSNVMEKLVENLGTDYSPVPSSVSSEPLPSGEKAHQLLSRRELEIAGMVVAGMRNKEIAKALYITEGTVKNHVSNIFEKLGVTNRTQLSRYIRPDRNMDSTEF